MKTCSGKRNGPAGARGYRRLLVPLDARRESFDALQIACRLAVDDHARITAVSVIEVPALLPLDALGSTTSRKRLAACSSKPVPPATRTG